MTVDFIVSEEMEKGRKIVVSGFYAELLGRKPSSSELDYFAKSDEPLERVYLSIKAANYSEFEAFSKIPPISAVVLAKNAAESIDLCLSCMKFVSKEIIVLVDDSTTDNTEELCQKYGARTYRAGFSDFGHMKTICAHLARQPWVLLIDSDEILCQSEEHKIKELIKDEDVDIWGLPRRRWEDLTMTTREEEEAYPDWQYRLFRNYVDIKFEKRVHEVLVGSDKIKTSKDGPHIEHFQSVFKSGESLKKRNSLYRKLYALDLEDGVEHSCPAVAKIDEE